MLLSYVCCRTLFFSFANQTHVAYKLVREYVKDQMKNILASLFVLTLAISNVVLAKGGGGGGGGQTQALQLLLELELGQVYLSRMGRVLVRQWVLEPGQAYLSRMGRALVLQ